MPYDETAVPRTSALAAGTLVADRYRIDSPLGEGGMGAVYLAEHVHIRKRVALKVLLPELSRSPDVVARFEREAIAGGNIAHPNVVAATDFGRMPDGSFFLVLEYIPGRTLRAALKEGPLDLSRALRITRGIASAVGAAHAKGIVHRDLKPENVMLIDRDGDPDFVKVLDFGVAKIEMTDTLGDGQSGKGTGLTKVGMIIGTPDYMSPEQALGQTIDARTDLYSIGVILFELLAGRCPFEGGPATVLRQHVLTDAPPLPDVNRLDPRVSALVKRLLEKSPVARFASATELIAALDEIARAPHDAPATSSSFGGVTTPALAHAPTTLGTMSLGRAATQQSSLRALVAPLAMYRGRLAAAGGAAVLLLAALLRISPTHTPHDDAKDKPAAAVSALPPPPPKVAPPPPAPVATTEAPAPSAQSPAQTTSSAKPASTQEAPKNGAGSGKRRRTGPGGIYVPPPSQWFK